jgi:hypothetical protein
MWFSTSMTLFAELLTEPGRPFQAGRVKFCVRVFAFRRWGARFSGARDVASVCHESLVARVPIRLLDLFQDLAEVVALRRLQRRVFFVGRQMLQP